MMKKYITGIFSFAIVLCATAQDLSKEITIEKDFVPEERSATRLKTTPRFTMPKVERKKLDFSERRSASEIEPSIATLEPAPCADTLPVSPYNGYVRAGYFPIANTTLSAGYRFINTKNTRLNAWLQHDGIVNGVEMPNGDEITLRTCDVSLGIAFGHRINTNSLLSANVDYSFYRFNNITTAIEQLQGFDYRTIYSDDLYQSVNDLNIDLGWESQAGEFDYSIGLEFGHFAYGQSGYFFDHFYSTDGLPELRPVRENLINLNGTLNTAKGDNSAIGLDIGATFLNYNRNSVFVADERGAWHIIDADVPDYGIIALTPHFDYENGSFSARIGAKVDLSINSGDAFAIAPDISAAWTPLSYLTIQGSLGGGEHLNTLESLFDYTRYSAPMMAYGKSSVPLAFDLGMTIGPWRGAYIELFGGYAKVDNWFVPAAVNGTGFFTSEDIDGWHAGVKMGYNYRDIIGFDMSYECSERGKGKGYYLWRDLARQVVEASVKLTPIPALDITAQYELRTDRALSMGDSENLTIGAAYRLNERFSVFASADNVLNNNYIVFNNVPEQGITALAGFAYKF